MDPRPWQREQIEAIFWIVIALTLSLLVSVCVWIFKRSEIGCTQIVEYAYVDEVRVPMFIC
jgi:hypothetical protein